MLTINAELVWQIAVSLSREFPGTDKDWTVALKTAPDELFGNTRPALVMVFISASLLLLIAWANVTNLLLGKPAEAHCKKLPGEAKSTGSQRRAQVRCTPSPNIPLAFSQYHDPAPIKPRFLTC